MKKTHKAWQCPQKLAPARTHTPGAQVQDVHSHDARPGCPFTRRGHDVHSHDTRPGRAFTRRAHDVHSHDQKAADAHGQRALSVSVKRAVLFWINYLSRQPRHMMGGTHSRSIQCCSWGILPVYNCPTGHLTGFQQRGATAPAYEGGMTKEESSSLMCLTLAKPVGQCYNRPYCFPSW